MIGVLTRKKALKVHTIMRGQGSRSTNTIGGGVLRIHFFLYMVPFLLRGSRGTKGSGRFLTILSKVAIFMTGFALKR